MALIYFADDEGDVRSIVAGFLREMGHEVEAFACCEELLEAFRARVPDLVVLDIMMPGMSGIEALRRIRATSTVPVIMLTAKDRDEDYYAGLSLGADDYLTKPFDLDELSARIEVQLRHRRSAREQKQGGEPGDQPPRNEANQTGRLTPPLRYREWVLDPESHEFSAAGTPLALTRTEFGILELLMGRPAKVFTKQELFEIVWGEPYAVDDSTVNVHVSNLRRKLKLTGTDDYLQTVWGLGYKLA